MMKKLASPITTLGMIIAGCCPQQVIVKKEIPLVVRDEVLYQDSICEPYKTRGVPNSEDAAAARGAIIGKLFLKINEELIFKELDYDPGSKFRCTPFGRTEIVGEIEGNKYCVTLTVYKK